MTQLKYYDPTSGTWVTAVVGAQGPQGNQGAQGVQGAGGSNAWIYASDYGVAASRADNTTQLQAWLDAINSTGRNGWIDTGTYRYSGQLKFYNKMILRGSATSGQGPTNGSILMYTGSGGRTTTSATAALGATQVAVNTGTLTAGSSGSPIIGTIETQYGNQSISYYVAGGILYLTTGSFIGAIASGAQIWNKAINANSLNSITTYDLTFTYTNKTFAGVLLDFSGASIAGGPGITSHIFFYGGCITGFYFDSYSCRLVNLNNSYSVYFNGVKFGSAYNAIEGCSSTSGSSSILYNYVNGMTIKDCAFDNMAGMAILNPGESCTIINPTVEPDVSGVANFLVGNIAGSVNDACSIVGGWIGDATSGSWVTWQGGSFTSTGVLYGYRSKMLTLTGDTSAVVVTGGSISAGTYPTGGSAIDLGNYAVGSLVVQGITWGSNVSTRVVNSSGVISANYESSAGTHTTDALIGSSFTVSGGSAPNLASANDAYQATSGNTGTSINNNNATITYDTSKIFYGSSGSLLITNGGTGASFGIGGFLGYFGSTWPNYSAATAQYIAVTPGLVYTAAITLQPKNSTAIANPGSWRIQINYSAINALTITNAVVTGGNLITYNFTGCSTGLATTLSTTSVPRIAGFASSFLNSGGAVITSVSAIVGGAGSFTVAGTGLTNGTYTALASGYTEVCTNISIGVTYSGYVSISPSGPTQLSVTLVAPQGATHVRSNVYCQTTSQPSGATMNVSLFGIFQSSSNVWTAPGASSTAAVTSTGINGGGLRATGFGFGVSGTDLATVSQLPTLAGLNGLSLTGGTMTGPLDISGAGNGLAVAEGSNAKQGVATLSAGTVTVSNTSVTATSRIFLTVQSLGTVAVPQALAVTARTAGTSFTITSASITDTSTVAYEIFEVG